MEIQMPIQKKKKKNPFSCQKTDGIVKGMVMLGFQTPFWRFTHILKEDQFSICGPLWDHWGPALVVNFPNFPFERNYTEKMARNTWWKHIGTTWTGMYANYL